jgi:hypothetical protein
MKHAKELRQIYGGRKPKSYLPAHNRVSPAGNGFRCFWIPPQWVGHGWSKCGCGVDLGVWKRAMKGPHYAERSSLVIRKKRQHKEEANL